MIFFLISFHITQFNNKNGKFSLITENAISLNNHFRNHKGQNGGIVELNLNIKLLLLNIINSFRIIFSYEEGLLHITDKPNVNTNIF